MTSGGEGRFYDTREAALAEVRHLQAKGVSNIDVGCMQINLMHHGHEFASVEHAMDPAANVAYAAAFLKSLKDQTGDWREAAARYHSSTPEKGRRYLAKIDRLWAESKKNPAPTAVAAVVPSAPIQRILPPADPMPAGPGRRGASPMGAGVPAIDYARTEALNNRFKTRREAPSDGEGSAPSIHQRQLAAWRGEDGGGASMAVMSTMRRSELDSERKRRFMGSKDAKKDRFAARRQWQIEKWRSGQAVAPTPTSTRAPGES